MDTALRRRFDVVEMMPDAEVFKDVEVEGIKIKDLLEKINKRIEFLYDREHTIGHAYFKELLDKENRNIETLRKIFIKKIIPLLQEYFYDDYNRIRSVLGDNQFNDNNMCFIKEKEKMVDVFLGNVDIDMDAKTYTVNEKINEFEAERFSYIYKPFVKGE
jgi:5-methylcytosine-specific restriction protein B